MFFTGALAFDPWVAPAERLVMAPALNNRKSIAALLGDDRAPIWRGNDLYWEMIVLDVVGVSEFCARQIEDCCALQRLCRGADEPALGREANCII